MFQAPDGPPKSRKSRRPRPEALPAPDMSSQSRGDAVLAAWTTLEVLTPQTVPDSDALSAMGRQLVRLAEEPEPWTLPRNRPQTKDKTIFWFVYLGLLDLNAATRSLLDI